jgi:ketosteroid isomerase-like protein
MTSLSVSSHELVEDQVKSVITNMVMAMNVGNVEKAAEWVADDAVFVRPTGNPLTKQQWVSMLNSPDVKIVSNEVKDFHRVDVHQAGDWALICYTTHAKFNYKGTENDDVSVFSVIVKRNSDKGWKLSWLQRSTGRLPTDEMPVFN